MREPLRISVVIATYNRRELLARTLPTLFNQDFPPEQYEVVVVVDGAADGTATLLQSMKPACRFLVIEQPHRGQAGAQNAGLRAAEGELVLFLDDDILCPPNLLVEHGAAHQRGPGHLVFGPIRVSAESPGTLAADRARQQAEAYIARLSREVSPRWPEDALVDANSSADRALLLAQGGYDEDFVNSRDNADFGLRLWQAAGPFLYCPAAAVEQIYVKTSHQVATHDAAWFGRNEVLLCRRHPTYRPYSPLTRLAEGPWWMCGLRAVVAYFPWSPEPILRWPCRLAEHLRGSSVFRWVGIRLLEMRMGITMVRSAVAAVGSWRAFQKEFFSVPLKR